MHTHHIYQCNIKENPCHCHQDPVQSSQRHVAHCYSNEHANEGSQRRDKVVEESGVPLHSSGEEDRIVTYRRRDHSTSAGEKSDSVQVQIWPSEEVEGLVFVER